MKIGYRIINTPHAAKNYVATKTPIIGDFTVKPSEFMWSAVSYGKDSIYTMQRHGYSSRMELSYRAAIVKANLNFRRRRSSDEFGKTYTYLTLDPTEKGAVSYFLGSTVSKYAARELYGIDWLLHIDVHGANYAFHVPTDNKPDFIGIDKSGCLHVIESKGSSGAFNSTMHRKALKQAKQNFTTAPRKLASRNAVQAHFNMTGNNGTLRCRFEDPEPEGEAIPISVNTDRLIEVYYHDIFQTCRQFGREYNGFILANISDGIAIGMDIGLYENYANRKFDQIIETASIPPSTDQAEREDSMFHIGSDRICVLLDEDFFASNGLQG